MTNTATESTDSGLLDGPFSIGAAVVAVVLALIGIVMAWTGYQGDELLVVGTELSPVTGMAGLLLTWFFAVVALVVAIYMEPGFDR